MKTQPGGFVKNTIMLSGAGFVLTVSGGDLVGGLYRALPVTETTFPLLSTTMVTVSPVGACVAVTAKANAPARTANTSPVTMNLLMATLLEGTHAKCEFSLSA
jgi:hypothetical protein